MKANKMWALGAMISALALAPGTYTVELTNPNSRQTTTRKVTVNAGGMGRVDVDLDPGIADAYLKRLAQGRN